MKKLLAWWVVLSLIVVVPAGRAAADDPSPKDMMKKAAAAAMIPVNQAMEIAQKHVPDGKLIEVELKDHPEPIHWKAELMIGDKVKEVKIDAVSGKVLGAGEAKMVEQEEPGELAQVRQAMGLIKVNFIQAIEAAEKEVRGGKVVGAEIMGEKGKTGYEVEFMQGDKCVKVEVDGASGNVLRTEEKPLPLAVWTFDKDPVGKTPAGLIPKETHPGKKMGEWKVEPDKTAPSTQHVLKLMTEEEKATFNLALLDKTSYKDVDLRVHMRADSGKEDQGGGLVWRCKDENNYYICRVNPLEKNVRVYKVVDGKREQLATAECKVETGKWYKLRAMMIGAQIECFVDGQQVLKAKDDTFKDAGMIGLWTKADASCSFENIAVFPPKAMEGERKAEVREKAEEKVVEEGMEGAPQGHDEDNDE